MRSKPSERKQISKCRTVLSLLLFLSLSIPRAWGQGSSKLTIYDEAGIPFHLWLNGERKSKDQGSPRITVDSIPAGSHELLIRYPDTTIPKLEQGIQIKSRASRTYALSPLEGNEGREWNLISEIRSEGKGSARKKQDSSVSLMTSEKSPLPQVDSAFIASYEGSSGCTDPMQSDRFDGILKKVEHAIFEKERIRMAKERIADRCVLSSQVAALMRALDYEENRLDLAKYAYGRTFDQKNYEEVRKALNFERSRKELSRYLREFR